MAEPGLHCWGRERCIRASSTTSVGTTGDGRWNVRKSDLILKTFEVGGAYNYCHRFSRGVAVFPEDQFQGQRIRSYSFSTSHFRFA
jgi:hypothetical protein